MPAPDVDRYRRTHGDKDRNQPLLSHRLVIVAHELRAFGIKNPEAPQTHPLKAELERSRKYPEPVLYASREIDRGGFGKVSGRAGYFTDSVFEVHGLSQNNLPAVTGRSLIAS